MIAVPQILPVNKSGFIFMAVVSLLLAKLVHSDILFPTNTAGEKHFCIVLGLLVCAFAAVSMPASRNHLQLDANGMTIRRALWPTRRVNFVDVSPDGFAVRDGEMRDCVHWRYRLGAGPRPIFRSLTALHDLVPHHGYLLFNYGGRNTQTMCELLNMVFTQKKRT